VWGWKFKWPTLTLIRILWALRKLLWPIVLQLFSVVKISYTLRAGHTGSRVLTSKSLEVSPCNLSHWEHGSGDFVTTHKVPSPKHDVNACTTTLFVGDGLLLRVGSNIMGDPTLNTSPNEYFTIKIIKIPTATIINHTLMTSWDSKVGTWTPKLGLGLHVGTWDLGLGTPCEPALLTKPKRRRTFIQTRNGRTVRLYPLLWKTITLDVHFAHASPWLFTILITKPFLNSMHLLLKYGFRTEATHS
jgi:hypothetical protein